MHAKCSDDTHYSVIKFRNLITTKVTERIRREIPKCVRFLNATRWDMTKRRDRVVEGMQASKHIYFSNALS